MPDLLVIGGGPGGIAAAQTAARLGADVALVENAALGGTCVHAGCIPSGAFHRTATVLDEVLQAERLGLRMELKEIDWPRIQEWVGWVVEKAAGLSRAAIQAADVAVVSGLARFTAAQRLEVGEEIFEDVPVVLATGAVSSMPDLVIPPGCPVLTSTDAMGLGRIPDRLLVVGADRFSLEWADLFAHFGSRVTVISSEPRLLAKEDADIAGFLQLVLEQRGIEFQLDGAPDLSAVDTDAVLVADSRAPRTDGLGLELAGVDLDADGAVIVDEQCRTTAPGVFAAGDVTGPPWLSNRARAMGIVAASCALGGAARFRPERLPRSVNTHPELAAIGMTEEEATEKGIKTATGYGELTTSLHGITVGEDRGALKLVVDTEFGEILGAHMVGIGAGEVIAQVAVAMELEADYRDLARVQHLHPSLAELVTDAIVSI